MASEVLPDLHALDCRNELLFTEDEVTEILIATLCTSKTSGPDGISGMMIKLTYCFQYWFHPHKASFSPYQSALVKYLAAEIVVLSI